MYQTLQDLWQEVSKEIGPRFTTASASDATCKILSRLRDGDRSLWLQCGAILEETNLSNESNDLTLLEVLANDIAATNSLEQGLKSHPPTSTLKQSCVLMDSVEGLEEAIQVDVETSILQQVVETLEKQVEQMSDVISTAKEGLLTDKYE